MIRRPPSSTRTDTLFPYTTLFRSPGSPYPARAIGQKRRKEKRLDARRGGLAVRALDRGGPSRRFSIAATWPSREPVAPRKACRRHPAGGQARGAPAAHGGIGVGAGGVGAPKRKRGVEG